MAKGRIRVPAGVMDWAVATGVAALLLDAGRSAGHSGPGPGVLGSVLLVTGGLALVARRRLPLVVLAVTGVCAVGYQVAGVGVLAVSYLVAVYAAMRAGHRAVTVAVSVAMVATLNLTALASDGAAAPRDVLALAWLIAALAAGEAVWQAERRADEAERTREETARRSADEERLRIARELHDTLTHQISVVKVQSEVAVHLARKRGEQVPQTLLAIQQAGREASRELRATLEALRNDSKTPPYGLDHIPGLVERAREGGLEATLSIAGQRPDVPVAVGSAAYRIVQESLTNISRHAGASTATIRLDFTPDALTVRIDDDGSATPDAVPVPGLGLCGMRERVTALGGQLRAEPRSDRGFTVQARLPVEAVTP